MECRRHDGELYMAYLISVQKGYHRERSYMGGHDNSDTQN
jgi:hypothetical protein